MGKSGKGAKFPRKPSRRSSQRTVVCRRTGSATAKTEQPADEHRGAHNRQHTAKLHGVRHMQGHEEVSVRERNAYVQIRDYRQAADHTVHQLSRHAPVRSMQRLGIRALNTAGGTSGGSSVGSGSGSSGTSGSSTSGSNVCRLCGGTGKKIKEYYTGSAVTGKTKWCDTCNKEVRLAHYHVTCDLCKGKGTY